MADDLTIVASLLKDTNKKLDKLHSDNEQNDTKGDIIKDALPEVLNDIYQSNRQIAQWKKEVERDKNTDNIIKKKEETTQKILGDIKKPLKTLGLAIPKSGFNAFSEKASDISAEKALPSDFKLMVQAFSPKALTQGFKVGLGTMFKELGGGIKKIGSGMKSLATKGLTAAQRKSEEKEKDSKENKKDSFLKKMFGSTIKLLGGILKTVTLAATAGFIALAGAGALYALAKLIESPSWKTVAGIIEYVLNKLDDIFTWAYNVGGPLGVIGTALAGWYGAGGILTLAGIALKALGGKFLGKLGLTAATKGAATALGSKATGLGLLGKLGLLGGGLVLATGAMAAFIAVVNKIRDIKANKDLKKIAENRESVTEKSTVKDLLTAQAANKKFINAKRGDRSTDEISMRVLAAAEKSGAELTALIAKKNKEADATPLKSNVIGGSPIEISENLSKIFSQAIAGMNLKGDAKARVGQIKTLFGDVSSRVTGSKAFQDLDDAKKREVLKKLGSEQQKAFSGILRSGSGRVGIGGTDSDLRQGLSVEEQRKLMRGFSDLRREFRKGNKEQIKNPSSILPELNDKLSALTHEIEKLNNAKNGGKGNNSVAISSVDARKTSITAAAAMPLTHRPVNGQAGFYSGFA